MGGCHAPVQHGFIGMTFRGSQLVIPLASDLVWDFMGSRRAAVAAEAVQLQVAVSMSGAFWSYSVP